MGEGLGISNSLPPPPPAIEDGFNGWKEELSLPGAWGAPGFGDTGYG